MFSPIATDVSTATRLAALTAAPPLASEDAAFFGTTKARQARKLDLLKNLSVLVVNIVNDDIVSNRAVVFLVLSADCPCTAPELQVVAIALINAALTLGGSSSPGGWAPAAEAI